MNIKMIVRCYANDIVLVRLQLFKIYDKLILIQQILQDILQTASVLERDAISTTIVSLPDEHLERMWIKYYDPFNYGYYSLKKLQNGIYFETYASEYIGIATDLVTFCREKVVHHTNLIQWMQILYCIVICREAELPTDITHLIVTFLLIKV